MKKRLTAMCLVALASVATAWAQDDDEFYGAFNRLAVGVGVSNQGVVAELGFPLFDYAALRVGYNKTLKKTKTVALPTDLMGKAGDYSERLNLPAEMNVDGQKDFSAPYVMLDLYPFKSFSLRLTGGFYFGQEKIVTIDAAGDALKRIYEFNSRTGQFADFAEPAVASTLSDNDRAGLDLGDYLLEPAANGRLGSSIKVNPMRTYLGLGFGRAVPRKRLALNVDAGVMLWGTPKVFNQNLKGEDQLVAKNLKGSDKDDTFTKMSDVKVYPCVTVRLVGRLF